MARGDMAFVQKDFLSEATILNRKENEAISMTLDFTGVSGDVVKAGTPVNKDGVPVTATPWTGAYGIVLHDCYKDYPTVAVVKEGYINVTRAKANCNCNYDAALVTALNTKAGCRIVFEEPVVL